ncbi:hypothetical protein AB0G04_09800 [Actinoplanes sp. NPDC023801]|uniref:hypothetical protein n=1 Tax=Actinoplanes sp. NPDC023801 TaxID=3154595 RepID=UPI0034068FAD
MEQPEKVDESCGDGVELVFGHSLGRYIGEVGPDFDGLLDCGCLGDPSGEECQVAAGVELRPVAIDLGSASVIVRRMPTVSSSLLVAASAARC